MRWLGTDAASVVRPTRVYLSHLFYSGIQFYVLLSLFFISFLHVDVYVLGDNLRIS